MHQNWNSQQIVITGAASGLGRAVCSRFAQLGATIYGIDINETALQDLKSTLGERFVVAACDVSRWEEVDRVFRGFSQIDVLVNSAGMTKVQGKEVAGTGVTVNALAPAVIQTPMVDAMPSEQVRYMTEKIPMGRCGSMEELVAMVEFIVSPHCSFTTGFTFDLTGGRATY
jgi:NAD(P)-dependent dehydrogenase (short-subunit alcohol dehydrogenase family)